MDKQYERQSNNGLKRTSASAITPMNSFKPIPVSNLGPPDSGLALFIIVRSSSSVGSLRALSMKRRISNKLITPRCSLSAILKTSTKSCRWLLDNLDTSFARRAIASLLPNNGLAFRTYSKHLAACRICLNWTRSSKMLSSFSVGGKGSMKASGNT